MPRASRALLIPATFALVTALALAGCKPGLPDAGAGTVGIARKLPAGPTTIVALGDSAAAGEGGGNYAIGTQGEGGDWCHRSTHSAVASTRVAERAVNLACSGAASGDVAFSTAATHDTEGSQAERLVGVATSHRVTTIVVQGGADDGAGFGSLMVQCVAAYLNPAGAGCADGLAAGWPGRLATMVPRVVAALRDVRTAMGRAGYSPGDYALIVESYPSPVTGLMPPTHGLTGCPYRDADAEWARTQAVPQLSQALRRAAGEVGARFLDLSRATEGREACSGPLSTAAGREWVRRLTVDPKVFAQGGLSEFVHIAQESYHPDATGYAQLGACLTEFVRSGAGSGACRVGKDGNLHAVATGHTP